MCVLQKRTVKLVRDTRGLRPCVRACPDTISGGWHPILPRLPAAPILQSRGGGGTSHSQLFQWWVWPLPPAGPLEFICQWPVYGIGETRVGIDGQVILDAARRSVQLWPEDG